MQYLRGGPMIMGGKLNITAACCFSLQNDCMPMLRYVQYVNHVCCMMQYACAAPP